jgi:hypothetical protein
MLKFLQSYLKPSINDVIKADLSDARHALHDYRAKADYYNCMVKLHEDMVTRLEKTPLMGSNY